jgi:predicted nucleotide-binding protein (sugar kinase/HSP70/actin superfamily)
MVKEHLLIPSMGQSSILLAAALSGGGLNASSIEPYDNDALHLGRHNTSGKECLPLQLVVGGLLKYLKFRVDPPEKLTYFMPTCGGNCRFSQYSVFLRNMIQRNGLDVDLMTLTNENGYAGVSPRTSLDILRAMYAADVLDDIRNTLTVVAKDPSDALGIFEKSYLEIEDTLRRRGNFYRTLRTVASKLRSIPLRVSPKEVKKISLMGEIFVRRDTFSCRDILRIVNSQGIVVHRAHLTEWLAYCDYNVKHGLYDPQFSMAGRLMFKVKRFMDGAVERKVKSILATSGLYDYELIDINSIMQKGQKFFDVRSTGEAILVACPTSVCRGHFSGPFCLYACSGDRVCVVCGSGAPIFSR